MTSTSLHPLARVVLPSILLAFACNGDKPGVGDGDTTGDGDGDITGDGDTIGDGDGDGDGDGETTGDGDGDPGDGDPGDGDPEQLRSDEPHDDDPQLEPGEAEILAASNHALTLDLYHALRDGEAAGKGFSISGYSIQSAFGMLYAGSLEPARGEIAQTLRYDLVGDQQHVAHNWLDAQLEARNLPAEDSGGDGDGDLDAVELRTANSLWILDALADQVATGFLDLLSIHYDIGLFLAAFDSQPEVERMSINGWVDERTNGLIPELLPLGSIEESTTLVVVNALYLKAPWSQPFTEGLTELQQFTRLDAQVVPVDMMRAPDITAGYAATADYEAVVLGLRGGALEFLVILPTDFEAFEETLDTAQLTGVLDALSFAHVDLRMPKLQLLASFGLTDELEALGMVAPFHDITSFDGIHEQIDVINTVVHKSVIKLDEGGVEAAAATAVGGDGDGDGDVDPPTVMVVDRPYLLAIRDRPTNTLLFFGRVLDPSE
jgi:serpin B